MAESWSAALAAALRVVRAPLDDVLPELSAVLSALVPHEGLVLFTGDCLLMSPLLVHGIDGVSADEVSRLVPLVAVDRPWFGPFTLAGVERPVLAVAVKPPKTTGGLLAVVTTGTGPPEPDVREIVTRLVELTTAHLADRVSHAEPHDVTGPSVTAVEDLADAHAATLTSLLGVLRSRRLDDAAARRVAVQLAVPALLEARAGGERDLGEEEAGRAFDVLAEKLSLLTRYHDLTLESAGPDQRGRPLPYEVARTARSVVRGAVLAMLQQGGLSRVRLSWEVADSLLRVTVRDDGPGSLAADALSVHRLRDRVAVLGGTLGVDAVPGWGTTITADLPFGPVRPRPPGPLDTLNPRERDVLHHLALGHRNRMIATRLGISENTVKFHVANILGKLGVSSRGEAAALAHGRIP
ncbi:LuxR C-terminal-related transcriptional regulator [Streptosporangium sp. NBC_01495]|uniref:helix-turn-helix transcriptional regulator n=1 Tax=Streptosporangium sp. NBC_01495 TaxID=2903899 RepID=UPI002E320BE1|nr:LuxR C-terminal-related transcriptional regulator [Streptosporangium sp. NBC_01495]